MSRRPWSDQTARDMPMTGERRLWCEVLSRALSDALCLKPSKTSNSTSSGTTELVKSQGRSWFDSRDFRLVCDYANFEPDRVRKGVTPLFDDPTRARAFLVVLNGKFKEPAETRLERAMREFAA